MLQSTMFEEDDCELIARAQQDQGAFGELFRRHKSRVYQKVVGLVGDADDADDIVQEVFIKAYRSLSHFRGDAKFQSWLYRICINCFLDWKDARKSRIHIRLDRWEDQGRSDILRSQGWPSDMRVMRRELRDRLRCALDTLDPMYRDVFVLREHDQRSYDDIADVLSCSVGTVKSRLFRARNRLRQMLAKDYQDVFLN